MKKIICLILLFISFFTLASCTDTPEVSKKEYLVEGVDYIDHSSTYDGKNFEVDEAKWYVNLLDKVPVPDPYVYEEDGVYYIVGTTDGNINVTHCYVTEDFVNFEFHPKIFEPQKYNGWEHDTRPEVYAAEIYKFDGKYYMYYSAIDENKVRRNSVVVADKPTGPYKPIQNGKVDGLNNPLFYNKQLYDSGKYKLGVLDITVFVDDNNDMYMYYVVGGVDIPGAYAPQYIAGMKMKSPYEVDWNTHRTLVKPGTIDSDSSDIVLEWETYRPKEVKITEAPYMIKSNGKYYLTYSVNGCWNKYYNVCYAVSNHPLGNFVKPYEKGKLWTNLLMGYPGTPDEESDLYQQWSGFASGTGHHCFFKIGDQVMIGYHAHANPERDWNSPEIKGEDPYVKRMFALDYVHFDANGVPFVNGPTYSINPLPEAISSYRNIMTDAEVYTENVYNEEAINDNYIVDCYNLESSKKEVSLGSGESYIEIVFDQEYEIGGIAIYNSAFFDKIVNEIEYIDFGNGNIIYYPQFCADAYVSYDKKFVRPNSAFTIDIINPIYASSVTIKFNLESSANINEIVILGVE